uniref:Small ribosomal subunit protein eS21 n=34 Tax=Neoaves TaxID=3078114 RepID=A0A8C3D6B0_CORMO
MQNDAGEFVDLYVPRKCSASNRIIGAKDHASIQINISEVDKVTGRVNGQFKTYAICGPIRRMVSAFLRIPAELLCCFFSSFELLTEETPVWNM